jgi:hypothetical protein
MRLKGSELTADRREGGQDVRPREELKKER